MGRSAPDAAGNAKRVGGVSTRRSALQGETGASPSHSPWAMPDSVFYLLIIGVAAFYLTSVMRRRRSVMSGLPGAGAGVRRPRAAQT